MTRHRILRPAPGATITVLTIAFLASLLLLQSCKRADGMANQAPATPTPVAYLEDSLLTSRVRAALLLSPVVRSFNIGVESHLGAVLLSGMVADPTQLDLAMFVAMNVPGVTKVDSFMFSTGTAPPSGSRNMQGADSHAPELLQHQREQDRAPRPLPAASDVPRTAGPTTSEGKENVHVTAPQSTFRRWMRLTSGVLGTGSIQDELQIKP